MRVLAPVLVLLLATAAPVRAFAAADENRTPLVILMVWDGLRPDSVTPAATPNLYAFSHRGVYFAAHHSIYPSLTMVNAAALATGAPPGVNGIIGNSMYFAHLLDGGSQKSGPLSRARKMPVSLENPQLLAALSSPDGLDGKLVGVQTVAQMLLQRGGFVGIVGKTGPTFLFDDRAGAPDRDAGSSEVFVSDDRIVPQSLAQQLGPLLDLSAWTAAFRQNPPMGNEDERFTQEFIDRVLPDAAAALDQKRPALLVLWQHNPDSTEHADGIGTAAYERALSVCDANLGRVRSALAKLHLEDRTDLLVLSDHGFATVNVRVRLSELLVAQGLKRSSTSDDVVVAANFGSDAIYISPKLDPAARAPLMRKIVDYAAAQPWCGPIFSRAARGGQTGRYAGEIAGTFDQGWFGLLNPARSADLIISFRELADENNSRLTGPQATALVLDATGMHKETNHSQPLVHPMMGVSYADSGAHATTGNGTHGALGEYEMHNFGTARGPDFRASYTDRAPTSNIDIARTIAALLHVDYTQPGAAGGRVLKEALRGGGAPDHYRRRALSVALSLPTQRVVTTIQAEGIDGELYPSAATVRHIGVGAKSPASANPR